MLSYIWFESVVFKSTVTAVPAPILIVKFLFVAAVVMTNSSIPKVSLTSSGVADGIIEYRVSPVATLVDEAATLLGAAAPAAVKMDVTMVLPPPTSVTAIFFAPPATSKVTLLFMSVPTVTALSPTK